MNLPSKSSVRTTAKANRSALAPTLRQSAAEALVTHGRWRIEGLVVAGYFALGSELDPSLLMDHLAALGARLALPVLIDAETMIFRQREAGIDLEPAGFGTFGPPASADAVIPDLLLVPMLAFSPNGYRIGYGKGHYDRAIAALRTGGHDPALLGIAFNEQEVPAFETDRYDVPLHGVLTPSGLRFFEGSSTLQALVSASAPAGHSLG